jgi:hypothetical protein
MEVRKKETGRYESNCVALFTQGGKQASDLPLRRRPVMAEIVQRVPTINDLKVLRP